MCMDKIYIRLINLHHIDRHNAKYILIILQDLKLKALFSSIHGFCSLHLPEVLRKENIFSPEQLHSDLG